MRETPLRLTERGALLLASVQPMVDAALAAQSALEDAPDLHGAVTLTTVSELLRWDIAPRLPAFHRAYPGLRLRILADNRASSLAAGEADVALRMARPDRGELVSRKVRTASFGFFASSSVPLHPDTPWLGLTGSLGDIPEQRHARRAFATRPARLLVEDVEALGLAVEAGLGVAILPRTWPRACPTSWRWRLASSARSADRIPSRDVWLVVHRRKQHIPRVRAVMDWLTEDAQVGRQVDPGRGRATLASCVTSRCFAGSTSVARTGRCRRSRYFEQAGAKRVTRSQSGNVVFDAPCQDRRAPGGGDASSDSRRPRGSRCPWCCVAWSSRR